MHLLFVSSEVFPFAKTGGLADVMGVLPQEIAKLSNESSVILPLYKEVRQNGFKPALFKSNIKIKMGRDTDTFNLYFEKYGKVNVYFVEKDKYYDRDYIYGTPQGDYPDNAMRFGFLAKAVLASIPHIGRIDIIHLNDWQTALIPIYIKLFHKNKPGFKNIKTIFTIHNLAYQGLFGRDVLEPLNLPDKLFTPEALEFYGKISFMKTGILYSDAITAVSEGYAREILTEEFGCALEKFLRARKENLHGILNGVDYSVWNPRTDKSIKKNYDGSDFSGKAECKTDLFKYFGIELDGRKPLVGMITRLAQQKGIDIVAEAMEDMLNLGINFVLLGTGDETYNKLFKNIEKKHKGQVGIKVAFDDVLAHKIEAGCDFFLMPSRYEPCGLNQMYSLKYATVPVVRAVGGLDDTIEEFDPSTKKGNGFRFKDASKAAILTALKKAISVYNNKESWNTLLKNCVTYDFSWHQSAEKYNKLYLSMLS